MKTYEEQETSERDYLDYPGAWFGEIETPEPRRESFEGGWFDWNEDLENKVLVINLSV